MRKSRLVIQPTKCLNHIGFLLLFLSCPVIGDWGRIQPESEASHRAIQIAREGTCGLQRDLPGILSDAIQKKGFNQCRFDDSKPNDINAGSLTSVLSAFTPQRKQERNLNEIKQIRKNFRVANTRNNENVQERSVSRTFERRRIPVLRSQSLERNVPERDVNTLSLSRKDNSERSVRTKRFTEKNIRNSHTEFRRENNSQRNSRIRLENKLLAARQLNGQQEKQEARTRKERNEKFETSLERQQPKNDKNERSARKIVLATAKERDIRKGLSEQYFRQLKRQNHKRDLQIERTENRERNINERSIKRLKQTQTQLDGTRRVAREKTERITTQEARKISENRQQQQNNLRRDARRVGKTETIPNRRSTDDIRTIETRIARVMEAKDFRRNTFTRTDTPSKTHRRIHDRSIAQLTKAIENAENRKTNEVIRQNELIYNRQSKSLDFSRTIRQNNDPPINEYFSIRRKNGTNSKQEEFFDGLLNRMADENYKDTKIGEWTLNCIIGAVAYYVNSKHIKTH